MMMMMMIVMTVVTTMMVIMSPRAGRDDPRLSLCSDPPVSRVIIWCWAVVIVPPALAP
jgi:hypothetical protein